jgi:hypothetical protein
MIASKCPYQKDKTYWRRKRKMTGTVIRVWAALLFLFRMSQVQIPSKRSPFVLEVFMFFQNLTEKIYCDSAADDLLAGSFRIYYNSLFTTHRVIKCYIILLTGGDVKRIRSE